MQFEAEATGNSGEQTKLLAAKLGNLVIVRKGQVDLITDGQNSEKFHFKDYAYIMYTTCINAYYSN